LKVRSSAKDGWLPAAIFTILLDLVGIAVFTAGYALAFVTLWQGNEARRQLTIGIVVTILVVRLLSPISSLHRRAPAPVSFRSSKRARSISATMPFGSRSSAGPP
jgi:hypothetical protein